MTHSPPARSGGEEEQALSRKTAFRQVTTLKCYFKHTNYLRWFQQTSTCNNQVESVVINKIVNKEVRGLAVLCCKQLAVWCRVREGDFVNAQVAAVHERAPERESRGIGALQPASCFIRLLKHTAGVFSFLQGAVISSVTLLSNQRRLLQDASLPSQILV